MLKIIIFVVLFITAVTGFVLFQFISKGSSPKDLISNIPVTKAPRESTGASDLKNNPLIAAKDIPGASDGDKTVTGKLDNLELKLAVLQKRVEQLEGKKTTTTTSTTSTTQSATSSQTSKPPLYITLGSGGSFTDRNYANFGGYIVNIDPANYSGYKNMQLEVTLRLNIPGEKTKARLFNSTDNSSISNSEVSTTSTSYVLLTSGTFTLPTGSKTYHMQVQSTDGVETFVQTARIKVNY